MDEIMSKAEYYYKTVSITILIFCNIYIGKKVVTILSMLLNLQLS